METVVEKIGIFKIMGAVVAVLGLSLFGHTAWSATFGGEGLTVFAGFRILESLILICLAWGLTKLDAGWEAYKADRG